MNSFRIAIAIPLLAILLAPVALVAPAIAADDAKADPPAAPGPGPAPADKPPPNPFAPKPPNPFTSTDIFAGTFVGDEMTIKLTKTDGSYTGELLRGDTAFPLTAKRDDKSLKGTFRFSGFDYEFTASLDGDTLTVTTDNKPFVLKRQVVKPVVPVPAVPPVSPVKPDPGPPVTPPVTAPLPVPTHDPERGPGEEPEEAAVPVKLPTVKRPQDLAWLRFGTGASVTFDMTIALPNEIPAILRQKLTCEGLIEGMAGVELRQWNADARTWELSERQQVWLPKAKAIDELGFTKKATRSETMQLDTGVLRCEVTTYTRQVKTSDNKSSEMEVEIWRCSTIDVPTQELTLPEVFLLLTSDVARVTATMEQGGNKGTLDFKLTTTSHRVVVNRKSVTCAVYKGALDIDLAGEKVQGRYEHWLSHAIPGGVVMGYESAQRGLAVMERRRQAVAFSAGAAEKAGK
ncbi:MAG: hypothetical protein WD768_15810 [Phycisphaeraceae bacterium]